MPEGCGLPMEPLRGRVQRVQRRRIATEGGNDYKVSVTGLPSRCLNHAKHSAELATGVANRVEIIHPSHTTVRTVRYTAVRFFGQEYIPACHFFRFLKIILSPPFRIFASSAIFRQEVSPITAFCFNV